MVDARDELDDGGLEGVVGREGQEDAEGAAVEGRRGGGPDGDVPGVQGLRGREGDGEALGRRLGELAELLFGVSAGDVARSREEEEEEEERVGSVDVLVTDLRDAFC